MALNMAELERWQRAAARALAADLPSQLRQRGNAILVPSKSTEGAVYHVALSGAVVGQCDCPAGLLNRPCAHRASVAIRLYEKQTGTRVVGMRPAAVQTMGGRYLRA